MTKVYHYMYSILKLPSLKSTSLLSTIDEFVKHFPPLVVDLTFIKRPSNKRVEKLARSF